MFGNAETDMEAKKLVKLRPLDKRKNLLAHTQVNTCQHKQTRTSTIQK